MLPEECQNNPACSFSANRFQYELIINLLHNYVGKVTAICPLPMWSYPQQRPLFVKKRERIPRSDLCITSPGFVNFSILKILSLMSSVFFTAVSKSGRYNRPSIILSYNPYLGYAIPALILGRLWHIPVVSIVADLAPPGRRKSASLIRKLEGIIQRWTASQFDGMLPFSIFVARDMHFSGKMMRLDPGIDTSEFINFKPFNTIHCERALMFSGTLDQTTGIFFLLEAFSKVKDPTIQLWISGRGYMSTKLFALSQEDPRIRFLGFLKRDQLLGYMQKSLVLVNPRPPNLPENRYSFPSKILEYLAVGRPVISTVCADIKEEFGSYLIFIDEGTPEALARKIEATFQLTPEQLDELGSRGRKFVLEKKNWQILSKRVADFLNILIEEFISTN